MINNLTNNFRNNIINTINSDILMYNKTICKLNILISMILIYVYMKLKNNIIPYIIFAKLVLVFNIKQLPPVNITESYEQDYSVIKISNNITNIQNNFLTKKYYILILIIHIIMNHINTHTDKISGVFVRTLSYPRSKIVIRYDNYYNTHVPNKFVLLLNHTFVDNDDYTHLFQTISLFPDHKYVVITSAKFNKYINNIMAFFGSHLFCQYNNPFQSLKRIICLS